MKAKGYGGALLVDANGSDRSTRSWRRAGPDTPGAAWSRYLFEEVHDLTAQAGAGGRLPWDAPSGEWEVLRIGYTDAVTPDCALPCARVSTASDAWQGLALDYLSRDALTATGAGPWNRCCGLPSPITA